MRLKCTGCGDIAENEQDIRFCRKVIHENGDTCGSLMLPTDEPVKVEKTSKGGK